MHAGKGNITPNAEFNFYQDPEAANVVLGQLGCRPTLITWELCLDHSLPWVGNNTFYLLPHQWRRQDFVTGGGVRYGTIGGLEYEVPQSRLYCLCINVALCSTALQSICRVIRRSSMTMTAHTYYIILDVHP